MILQTDYTRRIWTGLSTDDWGQADLQEGDVAYLMDVSQCWVFGEYNMYQLPDLGGGCPVLTKLASGDYTVTALSGSVSIPVTHTGTVDIIDYIKDSVASGTNHVFSGIRQLTPPAVDNVGSFILSSSNFGVYSQYSSNGTRTWQGANNSGGSLLTYSGTPSAVTNITIQRYSSTIQVQPGTYHWELWGYES